MTKKDRKWLDESLKLLDRCICDLHKVGVPVKIAWQTVLGMKEDK